MGPSGAGKTTLLCALANRFCGEVRGDIRINGWPAADKNIKRLSALIPQNDLFIETLTTREHMEFMVGLRYHFYSKAERKLRVNELVSELGLKSCENTRISSLSGGQRKRLIFASEIVTDPPLLFCDEPTSGLDSHTAHTVISLLQQLAARGRTVICSIHQPSSQVFSAFGHLILLAEGRVAFTGDREEAQEFFNSIRYKCPENYNPADFYIQALAGLSESEDDRLLRIQGICDSFAHSQAAVKLSLIIQQITDATFLSSYAEQIDDIVRGTMLPKPSWWTQLCWLTWRSFTDSIRNPLVHAIRTAHKVMTSILIATCFAGVTLNQKGIQDIEGALFIFLTENNFPSCYAILNVLPQEIPIFLKEHSNRLYRCDVYYISKILSLIPGFVLEPLLFTSIAYWIIGLRPDFFAFIMTAVVIIMTANTACAYGCLLSAACESLDTSTMVMMPLNQIIMVSAGVYVNIRTIPIYINWAKYGSWMMYSNEALAIIQWDGIYPIECEKRLEGEKLPCVTSGHEVLSTLGFEPKHLYLDLAALACIFCVLHVLGFFSLWVRTRCAIRKHSIYRSPPATAKEPSAVTKDII